MAGNQVVKRQREDGTFEYGVRIPGTDMIQPMPSREDAYAATQGMGQVVDAVVDTNVDAASRGFQALTGTLGTNPNQSTFERGVGLAVGGPDTPWGSAVSGILDLFGNPEAGAVEALRQADTANDPRQEARMRQSPVVELGANILGTPEIAPSVAAAGLTVSRAFTRGVKRGVAMTRAARAGMRETGAPGSMTGNTLGANQEAVRQGLVARTRSALFSGDPPSQRTLNNADRLGLKLTPADRTGSVAHKNVESALTRNPAAQAVFESEIVQPNQMRLNQLFNDAIGQTGDKVTPEGLGKAVDDVRALYRQAGQQGASINPRQSVNVQSIVGNINLPSVRKEVQGAIDNLPDKTVRADEVFELLSDLRDEAAGQFRNGSPTVAERLEDIADQVEQNLLSSSPQVVADTLNEARNRWRNIRLGERASVLSEDGDVSPMGLRQAMRTSRYTNTTYRRGRSFGHKASDDLMDAVRVFGEFRERIGNSGTPTGNTNVLDPRTWLAYPAAQGYLKGGLTGAGAGGAAGGGLAVYGGSQLLGE